MGIFSDFKSIIEVMLHPKEVTRSRRDDVGSAIKYYYSAAAIPIVISVIITIIAFLVIPPQAAIALSTSGTATSTGGMYSLLFPKIFSTLLPLEVALVTVGLVLAPIAALVYAGLYHLIIGRLFKMYKGDYGKVVAPFIYASLPRLLIVWLTQIIQVLSILAMISVFSSAALHTASPLGALSLISPTIVYGVISGIISLVIGVWSLVVVVLSLSANLKMSGLKAFGTLLLAGVIILVIVAVVAVLAIVGIVLVHFL